MKRLSAARIAFVVGVLGFSLNAPAIAQGTVKIGSVLSVTGPASFLGEPEDKTLRMYVDKINAAGGVTGKKLELVIYDDGGDANKARTFATRLIEDDKVVAIVGGSTTGTSMAMIPVFEEAPSAVHFVGRRDRGRRSGSQICFQDAAYRQDGLRKDF